MIFTFLESGECALKDRIGGILIGGGHMTVADPPADEYAPPHYVWCRAENDVTEQKTSSVEDVIFSNGCEGSNYSRSNPLI